MYKFESAKAIDPEGHAIMMDVSTASDLLFSITIENDVFSIELDQQQVTSSGSHMFNVVLSDGGPKPSFTNEVSFSINIEYIPMDEEELKELIEFKQLEESL